MSLIKIKVFIRNESDAVAALKLDTQALKAEAGL